jgi:hypothetical protein
MEIYHTKKGKRREKRMSPGSIASLYKSLLSNMKKSLETIVIQFFNENYVNNRNYINTLMVETEVLKKDLMKISSNVKKDFYLLLNKVNSAFDLNKFVLNLSKQINEKHINEQYDQLQECVKQLLDNNNTTHDELIHVYKLISDYNLSYIRTSDTKITKETSLSTNSFLYQKSRDIMNNNNINNNQKELLLESFILSYEKEFTLNMIKNMGNTVADYKLLTKLFKHSSPNFITRIKHFVEKYKLRNYEIFAKYKDDLSKLGDHLALALFIVIDYNLLVNIIFSKVVRLIGLTGGITQTDLLNAMCDEMLITFKYNMKNVNLNDEDKEIVDYIADKLHELPLESKYKFADLLLEFIFDEFDYIFDKYSVYKHNMHYIYITIKPEYLAILTSSIFNPIKLPMIVEPKI